LRVDTAIAFVLLAVGLIVATALLPRYWKHDITALDRPQPWWVFGGDTWRAAIRIMPVSIVGGWIVIATGIAMWLEPAGETRSPWAVPLGAGLLMSVLLMLTIWFWNWPKLLVPPYLRNERGVMSELSAPKRRLPRKSKRSVR
jgi:hypothetical protein